MWRYTPIVVALGLSMSVVPSLLGPKAKSATRASPIVASHPIKRPWRPAPSGTPASAVPATASQAPPPGSSPSTPPPTAAAVPAEEIPEADELDAVFPGLTAAFRKAHEEARAGLMRAGRRCGLQLEDEPALLEWESVETFERDEAGGAVSTQMEIHPLTSGNDVFYTCLAEATVGQTQVVLPDGFEAPFRVRSGGRKILDPNLDPDEIKREVVQLRERLDQPGLSTEARAALEDHLALWECYERRGPAARRACREDSVR